MQYKVRLREWDRRSGIRSAYFDIEHRGEYYRAVKVSFSHLLVFLLSQSLGLDDRTQWEDPALQRGVHRIAVRSIEDALKAGVIEPANDSELFTIELPEDEESVSLLTALASGDKSCSYQETEGRDLFCTAASANDETALPIFLNNGRRVAPTSRPLCAGCSLPDTDYICSHFLHPQVMGIRAMGGPSGFVSRHLMDGMCDLNRPEFAQMPKCHAGGNPCWERIVEVESSLLIENVPPQAIQQALDDLDVRWRLALGRQIVRLPGAEDVSVLALPCASRDEFERRLSALADILKRLDIPDELFPTGAELPERSATLNRLEQLFRERLPEEDGAQVPAAVSTLRRINQLRVGGQHGGEAQKRRAQAADALGVPLDGRWAEAWERVRALTAHALRDIGNAARRMVDLSSGAS